MNSFLLLSQITLKLHGLFWFHTSAQPRGKYTHISLPVIHNYPLALAFLGRPVEESYANISGIIRNSFTPRKIWKEYGFYVYPAIGEKLTSKVLTFSMGGTGYILIKPQTRASVPDYTTNQVYLPGSTFRTYILARNERSIPKVNYIRLGSKRYGIFKVVYSTPVFVKVRKYSGDPPSHLFNVEDCPASKSYAILRHYAGNIALSGTPLYVIKHKDTILAAPGFL